MSQSRVRALRHLMAQPTKLLMQRAGEILICAFEFFELKQPVESVLLDR